MKNHKQRGKYGACDIIWTVSPCLIGSEVLLRLLATAVLTVMNSSALSSLASGVQGTAHFVAILQLQDWSHKLSAFSFAVSMLVSCSAQ